MFYMHKGAVPYTRDHIADVVTPMKTRTHFPIPHIELLERVENALSARGLYINEESHALGSDAQRYFGLLQVQPENEEYSIVIGVRNAHDKAFSAGLVFGARVFVCDNLSFSGEVKLQRAHTKYIMRDLPGMISVAVGKLADMRVNMDYRIQRYKEIQIESVTADHLVIQMVREKILVPSKVEKVINEWDQPTHPEFEEYGDSVWRLHNAATEVLKDNVMALPKRTIALHGLMDRVADIDWKQVA